MKSPPLYIIWGWNTFRKNILQYSHTMGLFHFISQPNKGGVFLCVCVFLLGLLGFANKFAYDKIYLFIFISKWIFQHNLLLLYSIMNQIFFNEFFFDISSINKIKLKRHINKIYYCIFKDFTLINYIKKGNTHPFTQINYCYS